MADDQFIRGAGMLAVLKVLEQGELYGYAIVEALGRTKGTALHLGQSTVYPMLYNLEAKGLVKSRWDESGARPRKYYSLTKAGKTRLAEDAVSRMDRLQLQRPDAGEASSEVGKVAATARGFDLAQRRAHRLAEQLAVGKRELARRDRTRAVRRTVLPRD